MSPRSCSCPVACRRIAAVCFAAAALAGSAAPAQLLVTELMYDPLDTGDTAWEWIEVYNSGASAVDVNGYYGARLGDTPPSSPAINMPPATNTLIPAGGVSVLYRGAIGGAGDFDDQAFRDAWGLSASVPLIAVENWPALTNGGGTAVGYWPASGIPPGAIVDDGMGAVDVANFTGAALSIDYTTANNFPSSGNGFSIAWNGAGSNQDGANWAASTAGNATTSQAVSIASGMLNSTSDVANPGSVLAPPAASGLLFTEIMYDPASAEPAWEWVEIYNNTGSTIDFSSTPYFFQDDDGADLTAANVTSGVIANGQTAILFSNTLTVQNMVDAWDPGGTNGTLFIPVDDFPQIANGGDTIAIWDNQADYDVDAAGANPRATGNAVAVVAYDDGFASGGVATDWPDNNGGSSIFLADLTADPNVGANWLLSVSADFAGSANAAAVLGSLELHPGGDVGTPGAFTPVGGGADADFDDDGDVDAADLAIWEGAFGGAATAATGDADGNSVADGADFLAWQRSYTGAITAADSVPEPATSGMTLLALTAAGGAIRRRQ